MSDSVSAYNASLVAEIACQYDRRGSGEADLVEFESFVASRVGLFERDGSGVRDATSALVAELEHIRYTSDMEHQEIARAVDGYLVTFARPQS